jgi:hypothetical protein
MSFAEMLLTAAHFAWLHIPPTKARDVKNG